MAGPHPPNPAVGADGPLPYPEGVPDEVPQYEFRASAQPPPAYPKRRRRRLLISLLAALTVVAAITAAIVYGVRTNGANTGATFNERSAKTAIQGYLDALQHHDIDTIVRNALCGIYDGVQDKRSDQALAKLNSEAFRKQYSRTEVTSIDKIVYWSQYQAQVLFSMRVTPATGGAPHGEIQGLAQLLFQRGQILVCSYVVRTPPPMY